MEVDGGYVGAQQGHVLDYQCVDPRLPQLAHQPLHIVQLVVIDNGVDRGIDLDAIRMRRLDHPAYVGDAVGGGTARAVARGAYIDGVGTGKYGLDGYVGVARRSEKFECGRGHVRIAC